MTEGLADGLAYGLLLQALVDVEQNPHAAVQWYRRGLHPSHLLKLRNLSPKQLLALATTPGLAELRIDGEALDLRLMQMGCESCSQSILEALIR